MVVVYVFEKLVHDLIAHETNALIHPATPHIFLRTMTGMEEGNFEASLQSSDVLSTLKGGASSSERFTSETENVLRSIDITVV